MDFDLAEHGWIAIPNFLTSEETSAIQVECARLLSLPASERWPNDKPSAGTHHLFGLDDRSPFISEIVGRESLLSPVRSLLGEDFRRDQISYRSPQPGFGGQKLHADGLPRLGGEPASVATGIVALVDFTPDNGATTLVPGSHRRPDLQRQAGQLDSLESEIRLTGPAGTAFVFDGNVLHSGTRNDSARERPALQLVWRN